MLHFQPLAPAGYLPMIFSELDPRPAKEQANDRYAHGGGWAKFDGFELVHTSAGYELLYPEDPPLLEISRARLRDELIVLFECSFVAIIQLDGSYEVARMD